MIYSKYVSKVTNSLLRLSVTYKIGGQLERSFRSSYKFYYNFNYPNKYFKKFYITLLIVRQVLQ